HNADGWRAALAGAHPPADGRLWALVGVMRDKDAGTLADLLAVHGARVLAVGLDSDRALPAGDVADMLRQRGVVADAPRSAAEALAVFRRFAGPHDRMLVTGSHQTVAAVLREP
ncbi:MAG: bifunctional folylpolyglutamate synthase/dihydrofolate synthase, partial [Bacteroidota bacterium]